MARGTRLVDGPSVVKLFPILGKCPAAGKNPPLAGRGKDFGTAPGRGHIWPRGIALLRWPSRCARPVSAVDARLPSCLASHTWIGKPAACRHPVRTSGCQPDTAGDHAFSPAEWTNTAVAPLVERQYRQHVGYPQHLGAQVLLYLARPADAGHGVLRAHRCPAAEHKGKFHSIAPTAGALKHPRTNNDKKS